MRSLRMRNVLARSTALAAGAAALAHAGSAAAQGDLTPPLPNVMLLIDTSGSMEHMPDGTDPPLDAQGKCIPVAPGVTLMNRWATLVSVLTGTVQNYSCYAQPRAKGSPFETEYTVLGVPPYDRDYHLPFHRILSNDCTPGPGNLGADWTTWPNGAIKFHAWNDANTACAGAGFQQVADGLLDTFSDRARFGLMTFDTLISDGTGAAGTSYDMISGTGADDKNALPPKRGMWSYYLGWSSGGAAAAGNPPNCAKHVYEVGARNLAAPPWEGRLIPFGAPNADAATLLANNQHIQLALLAMRPYGATPIAGMMKDAQDFIFSDTSNDPATALPIGPAKDDYFTGGCRKTYAIVLSDGAPNMDLRKEGCASGNGVCPYQQPWDTAHDMFTGNPKTPVETFAVGFGLSNAAGIDCNLLTCNDFGAGGTCAAPANDALAACCTLTRIACNGGTTKAYFANDVGGLKSALSLVFGQITTGAKTRTLPAFSATSASSTVQGDAQAVGYRFGAQFDTPANSPLWIGRLYRERYKCVAQNGGPLTSVPQPVDASRGDNFGLNVNLKDSSHPRRFFTVIGDTVASKVYSLRNIRPKLFAQNKDDGLGLYNGNPTNAGAPEAGFSFAIELGNHPQALAIDPASPPNQCMSQLGAPAASSCVELLTRWEVGEVNTGLPTRDFSGCQVTDPISLQTTGCQLGSIYHSTPVVVGPPNEFLRDESYDAFATAQSGRPTVLYVSTTDGQLHAFKVAANSTNDTARVDKLENNELWAFLPPAVLPRLLTTYNQQAVLLDGPIVASDIVLERTAAQAIAGIGGGGPQWRSILLAGGGGGGGYYFALDVTDPTQPQFLWQLQLDSQDQPLFGATVPQPAIATISLSDNGGAARDVAVAILPGGSDALLAGTCARAVAPPYTKIVGGNPRAATRCWEATAGRTLTIVRLDTGEVIRSFISPKATFAPSLQASRRTVAPFDSPLTGVPVPYPARAGQVADRIYIGDADGTLWRVDLSKPTPDDWTVDMIWDGAQNLLPGEGQPIQTPPVVSIDNLGQPVLLFSTGDQELITSTTPKTRYWSLLEAANGTTFGVKENYHLEFDSGERVTGPISLFASTAYFASFKPQTAAQSGNVCTFGEGSIWGIDYKTGDGRLDPQNPSIKSQSQGPNSIVFGVAVTQTPSCSDSTQYNSPYFGMYQGISGGSAGAFQLVYQVSNSQSGPPQPGVSNVFKTQTLQPPRVTTRIDSWAAVVE